MGRIKTAGDGFSVRLGGNRNKQEPGRQWCRRYLCVDRVGYRWSLTGPGENVYQIYRDDELINPLPPTLQKMPVVRELQFAA